MTKEMRLFPRPMRRMFETPVRRNLVVLLLLSSVFCFLNLGGFPLTSMEPMVIDGAQHMLTHGQWAVPHLYGEMFMFKPPLALWMSALPLAVWESPSEFLLRLPFALVGLAFGLAVFGLFTSAVGPRMGLIAALAVIGSVQFTDKVRVAQYEMPLAAGVGIAVAAAVINLSQTHERTRVWLVCYFGLGMGFLAKGMPALMAFVPGLLVAAVGTGSLRRLFRWKHLSGLTLGALIIGGYLFWAHATAGSEVFLQAATEARVRLIGWDAESLARTLAKPVVVWLGFLPGTLAFFLWPRFRAVATSEQGRIANAALGFALGGVLAFIVVPTYQSRYYLPLLAPFAILSAVLLETLYDRRVGGRFLVGGRALFCFALLLLTAAGVTRGSSSWLLLTAAFVTAAVVAFRRSPDMHSGGGFARVLVATALVCAVGQALVTVPGRARTRDLSEVAQRIRGRVAPDETLWVLGPADCAARVGNLLHYLKRPIRTLPRPAEAKPGSMILLIEPHSNRLPEALDVEVLEHIHSGFDLSLIRVAGGGGDPSAEHRVGEELGWVGDLCRDRYRQADAQDPVSELDYYLWVPP